MANSFDSTALPTWWSLFPWTLALAVIGAGFAVWFQNLGNNLNIVSLYQVFPVLGIWAWSIMWTHYIIGELRMLKPTLPKNLMYHKISSVIVLFLLLLHPGILILEQYRQGNGLPPASYFNYAGEASSGLIILGMIGLSGFLFYELIVKFKKNQRVQNLWWLVNITQTVAMVSIFTHGLNLGGDLHGGWFRMYWVLLGLILIPCLVHTHWTDVRSTILKKK